METLSLGKPSDDELSIGPDDKDMYQEEEVAREPQQKEKKKPSRYKERKQKWVYLRPLNICSCYNL